MPPYLSGLGAAADEGEGDGLGAAEVAGAAGAEVAGLGAAAEEAGAGAGALVEGAGALEGVGEDVEQDMTNSEARITSMRTK